MEPHENLPPPKPDSTEWLESLNRSILHSALDCIITMDARGLVREFNPAAERVFGYRREEAIGQELAALIVPPHLRERHRAGLALYLETGEGPVLGRRIEIAALRKDGTEILVELAITAFRIGGIPVFTAYLRDITERVRTERRRIAQYAVASLLAGSQSLGEAAPGIIQAIAASGQWVFGSIWLRTGSEGLLECAVTWRDEEAAFGDFEDATRASTFAGSTGLPGTVATQRKPIWIPDVLLDENFPRREAAQAAHLRGAFAFPLFAENEINGVLELFSPAVVEPDDDLLQLVEALGSQIGLFIHRRKIEKELERQKEAAEAANQAKDKFLATLSHELRTPLTPILIWAGDAATQADLPEEITDGLRMICRNVELEARLIDDLLDVTRIARGKLRLRLQPTDAHELLRHALEIVQSDFQERRFTIELRLEASHAMVCGDVSRLQQVFWNLLRNAAKFTPEAGTLSIETSNPAPDRLVIRIRDSGIGIAPEFLEKIFDAFEQADTRREGLGLGLAISKAVVQMHGGRISAESAGTGQGATFVIELATLPDDPADTCEESPSVRS